MAEARSGVMTARQNAHQRYLNSPAWWDRRKARIAKAGGRCEFRPIEHEDYKGGWLGDRCTATERLEVHHLSYEALGQETKTSKCSVTSITSFARSRASPARCVAPSPW
jgi:hypothetical protein